MEAGRKEFLNLSFFRINLRRKTRVEKKGKRNKREKEKEEKKGIREKR